MSRKKTEDNKKYVIDLMSRYLILVLVAIPNLYIFYFIFSAVTIYPSYFLLSLFYDVSLIENKIVFGNISIVLIDACIAGSAYYLLTILNLTTPGIKLNKRANMIALSFISFLIINILRIFFLSFLFIESFPSFNFIHKFLWYFGSTFLVIIIWFAEVKLFNLKEIPVYSDLKTLYKKSLLGKK